MCIRNHRVLEEEESGAVRGKGGERGDWRDGEGGEGKGDRG